MPVTDRRFAPVEEVIHGVLVRDPYRWLEDRSLPETEDWICERQQHCASYFSECGEMEAIRRRVREFLDIPVIDQPTRVGRLCFYRRRDHGREQPCIFVRDLKTGAERSLVDPSTKGPFASVGIYRISRDGSLLACVEGDGGSDRRSVSIVDVARGTPAGHQINPGYTRGLVFLNDASGYFYSQQEDSRSAQNAILRRSFDGRPDEVVFKAPALPGGRLTVIGDDLTIGAVWVHGGKDRELVEDLWTAEQGSALEWRPVFADRPLPFRLALRDGRLFAVSYEDAANGKVVELDRDGSEKQTIVPDSGTLLRQVAFVGDRIFTCSACAGRSPIRCWSLEGEEIAGPMVPDNETVTLLPAYGPCNSLFVARESFDRPIYISEYEPSLRLLRPWPDGSPHRHSDRLEVNETHYPANDGGSIPITLVARRSSANQAPAPVIMTSYGSFGVPSTPQFSVLVSILLDCGFLFAIPHIRGGGEFGGEWHRAGRRQNKQTSFDDFLAAAAWLRSEEIADPSRLAIFGGSNSGLLVAVAMIQRPELFHAVLCIAPLLDMIRYQRFDQSGKWKDEYGSCDCENDFQVLHSYSPYHRFHGNRPYPSVLFVTGDQDDRCNPAHVRKMTAMMLDNPMQTKPVLVDYTEERGHSPTLPLSVRVEALTRRIAFLLREVGVPFRMGEGHDPACI
jgi:prolyl oligopeptidase